MEFLNEALTVGDMLLLYLSQALLPISIALVALVAALGSAMVRRRQEEGSRTAEDPGGQPVIPALRYHLEHTHMDEGLRAKLLDALEARKQVGIKEYGVELKTRCLEDPALEAQHEIEDGLCYTFTEKMERGRWTPRTAGAFHHLLQAWMILQADESGEPQGTPGAPKPNPDKVGDVQ